MKTFEEVGVTYTLEDPEEQLVFSEYTYTAWYQPSDQKFVCRVWLIGGRHRALELINAWNAKDPKRWHYVL